MKIKINIETIVLNGISRQETKGFVQDLQLELTRLVREKGVYGISSTDASDAGTLGLTGEAKRRSAGERTAHSIYRSLAKR
jgi:hypothetical protein